MSSINLVDLIVQAEQKFDNGIVKKQWVLNKLGCSGLNDKLASVLIDDIIGLVKSEEARKLFNDSGALSTRWCCLK